MKAPNIIIALCAFLVLALAVGMWCFRSCAPVVTEVLPLTGLEEAEVTVSPFPGKVNINTADLETLLTVPGIGEVLAKRIIHYRSEVVVYESLRQLTQIYGIDEKIYQKIAPYLTVQ